VEEVEDDEDAEARGLKALNQMHEELQEKRHGVEAHQTQARLQVIRQKVDEAREKLIQMDEYRATIQADPNYLPKQHDLPPPLQPNPPPLQQNPPSLPPPPRFHQIHPSNHTTTLEKPTSANAKRPKISTNPNTANQKLAT
jgi:hypothetical protein